MGLGLESYDEHHTIDGMVFSFIFLASSFCSTFKLLSLALRTASRDHGVDCCLYGSPGTPIRAVAALYWIFTL